MGGPSPGAGAGDSSMLTWKMLSEGKEEVGEANKRAKSKERVMLRVGLEIARNMSYKEVNVGF